MNSYRDNKAESTTITRDNVKLSEQTGNIYETLVICSKRSHQLNDILQEELSSKLNEFASTMDNLEEFFENKEQIEISMFYERLPKPDSIALDEYKNGKLFWENEQKEA